MTFTPTELETIIRQRSNTVGDSFWSSDEMLSLFWMAHIEMAREALCIERIYTTTSVADQQDYDYPTQTIAIKRITYDGEKLEPITMREDDALTLSDMDTTSTGRPKYYFVWNNTLYLRPIPDTSDLEIKIFSFNEPQEILTTSTFEIPSQFVPDTQYYVLSAMAVKEGDVSRANFYQGMWAEAVRRCKAWTRKRLRGDAFAAVQDADSLPLSLLGVR